MQLAFKKAVTDAIKKQPDRRVMPFLYENEPYFIKRRLSNHRNRFAKQSVDAAFWCEVYKILTVNQYGPMAPEIVLLHDDYFVMKAVGKTLQGVAKEAPWQDVRRKAFYKAGEALGINFMGLAFITVARPCGTLLTTGKKTV
nr:hypothetical protein [Acidaminococcus intestini]